MNDQRSGWNSVQGAAVIILLRLTAFFCCDAPYSAAYAAGMFAAALIQSALMLLLLRIRKPFGGAAAFLMRLYAVFCAAYLTGLLLRLYRQLRLVHFAGFVILLLLTLCDTALLRERAAVRAAVILLCIAVLGFLLLPVSGIGTARRILLHTPDSVRNGFCREWLYSCELPLILWVRQKQQPDAARRSTFAWAAVRCIFLPALVLFGAMQNGRLLRFEGNPFFLLLARTPLSDAVRTDGFWMLLVFGCGIVSITFCLQTAMQPARKKLRAFAAAFLPYLFLLGAGAVFGGSAVLPAV